MNLDCNDELLLEYLPKDKTRTIAESTDYNGNTVERTNVLVKEIKIWLENEKK